MLVLFANITDLVGELSNSDLEEIYLKSIAKKLENDLASLVQAVQEIYFEEEKSAYAKCISEVLNQWSQKTESNYPEISPTFIHFKNELESIIKEPALQER